jgi:hypothetical protein
MVDKIKPIFLVLILPTKSVFKNKKLCVLFPIKKILNIDKYFVYESRDMSDESGTYIILLKTIFGSIQIFCRIRLTENLSKPLYTEPLSYLVIL